ncbi:MAG TPA: heme-binding protein [Phycisphaerales bacterium]|nr:heme-binding protein [Phycisphaerales bacterium]
MSRKLSLYSLAAFTSALAILPPVLMGCRGMKSPPKDAPRVDVTAPSASLGAGNAAVAASEPAPVAAPAAPAIALPEAGKSVRLAGDPAITVTKQGDFHIAGEHMIDTPLPVGYPAPTPPETVELKTYPTLRRAEVGGERDGVKSNGRAGFWPLFRHIQRRDIEMTSPVEMDFKGIAASAGLSADAPVLASDVKTENVPAVDINDAQWTMSFLYRYTDQADAGVDPEDKRVLVVDTTPITVIAAGVAGSPNNRTVNKGVAALREFFASNPQYVPAGDIRGLFYNDPMVPENRKWAEIQIPVKLK